MKIITVAGARPNFMKIAPLMHEISKINSINNILVHTGQHYDKNMNDTFFEELKIPLPNYNLGIGSGSHAEQTANIMIEFEKICLKEKPELVVVVGDVNSTVACTLVARKLHIKVAHIEAGLRSFDEDMPEEINRIITDKISNYLFVSEESGLKNLKQEGINSKKIFHVGNIMIDSLIENLPQIELKKEYIKYNLSPKTYIVLTLHRPKNVDTKKELQKALNIIKQIQEKTRIIWPIHPRTKKNIEKFNLQKKIEEMKNIVFTEPLGYHEFMSLVKESKLVITDSGGIQEETTYLGVPCITLRENTERPSTITQGTNEITGLNEAKILKYYKQICKNKYKKGEIPIYWDGNTAKRIVKIIKQM